MDEIGAAHRIDVHHHILPPDYRRIVGDEAVARTLVSGVAPPWSPAHSIAAMDRNGVRAAVTSISSPGLWFGDRETTKTLCRHCNEFAAEMRRDHPGRFGAFACLPLPDVDASLEEAAFCLDTLKADGVGLLTNYDGRYPGDPLFAPVFEELDRRSAVVYFHPTAAACGCMLEFPDATIEFPFDTTRAIMSLTFSGALRRYPRIRFLFSHAGGVVPFLADRIARLERRPDYRQRLPDGVLSAFRELYFDTALSANAFAFGALRQLMSIEHILFGSDYPFAPEDTMAASIKALPTLGLSGEDLKRVERGNALALMPSLAD